MTVAPVSTPEAPSRRGSLAAFRDLHPGRDFLVLGCGESLNLLVDARGAVTIGVNDVGRRFTPDYLVVVNPRSQFSTERFGHVEASRARALFTQLADLGVPHPNVVRFRLGAYGGTDFSDPGVLHHTQNSPYVAACLAVLMGARRIGLVGVDFTDHHFFGRTGTHALARRLDQIDREYGTLADACRARGVELVNLSPVSRLTRVPRASLADFLGDAAAAAPAPPAAPAPAARVFLVTYRFLACGDVFTEGLRHAAEDLGVAWADAPWDDARLPEKVAGFRPDLLFVVHGRSFSRRWGRAFAGYRSAVWLLDEPYEVDDTSASALAGAFIEANRLIYEVSLTDERLHGMGTTCTALVLQNGSALCAHVGDSRIYLLRNYEIYQMTQDQSAVMEMVRQGVISLEEARNHDEKNVILGAMGSNPKVEVSTWPESFPVRHGDRFLLCSDGLHDLVNDCEMRDAIVVGDPHSACESLIALAKQRGGYDNISVAVLSVVATAQAARSDIRQTRDIGVAT